MSRIGKLPITIPAGVTITVSDDNTVTVKGPQGSALREDQPPASRFPWMQASSR